MKHFFLGNLLFINCLIFSQERPGVYLFTGLVNSSLKTSAVEANNSEVGYIAGMGYILGHNKRLSWQFELGYLNSPISLKANDEQFYKYSFANFQSGVYLTYNIIEPDEDKFYFGPQIGMNFDFGKFSTQDSSYSNSKLFLPSGIDELSLHEDVSNFNTNIVFGLNATFNRFKLNVRYSIGLTDIFKDVSTTNYTEYGAQDGNILDEGQINTISLILTYKLSRF